MLGIQARILPWTITNNIGVDAKRGFSIQGHGEVKGQVSAIIRKKWHFNIVNNFFHHKLLPIWTKTNAHENRMAQRLVTASKLTFAKKYRIYDNKHSGSIQIKEQYSPCQLSLPCTHRAFFIECQIVHNDTLKAKKSSKNEPIWAMWKCMVSMATHNAIQEWGYAYKITHILATTCPRLLNMLSY